MKKKLILAALAVTMVLVFLGGCDLGGGTTPPAYVGTWTRGDYFTYQFTETELTKLTYNETTRDTIFTGTKGTITEADGVITFTETQAYSSSMDWYTHNGAGTVWTYKWSVTGDTLTLTVVIDGVDQTPVEWTKLP